MVIVTGAAGNLGNAVAQAFQAAGARLALVDRAPDRIPRMFPSLANSPDHFMATSVDLTDAGAVAAPAAETARRLGRIDVLAHVAGGYRGGRPVHETPLETLDHLAGAKRPHGLDRQPGRRAPHAGARGRQDCQRGRARGIKGGAKRGRF